MAEDVADVDGFDSGWQPTASRTIIQPERNTQRIDKLWHGSLALSTSMGESEYRDEVERIRYQNFLALACANSYRLFCGYQRSRVAIERSRTDPNASRSNSFCKRASRQVFARGRPGSTRASRARQGLRNQSDPLGPRGRYNRCFSNPPAGLDCACRAGGKPCPRINIARPASRGRIAVSRLWNGSPSHCWCL